ncbi:hypothetical protein GX586_12965 [bacterium]|nr:hypothetical protein [bacterium]
MTLRLVSAGIACLLACTLYSAEYVAQPSSFNTSWNVPTLWDVGDFPRAVGDVAIITNGYIGNGTGERRVQLNVAVTVSVVRFAGVTPSNMYPNISAAGGRLYMESLSGNAQIQADSYTAYSWGSAVSAAMEPLSDTDIRVTTNKIFVLQSTLYGAGGLHFYVPRGGGMLETRSPASPDYTGTVYIEQSAGNFVIAQNSAHIFTNATVVIRNGATLTVGGVTRFGSEIRMEPGSRLDGYVGKYTYLYSSLVVFGNATNATRYNGFVDFRGDVSGTGEFVKINSAANGTNYFTGTISPGFSAGTLTINELGGVTRIGMPGTPVTLQIEDKDQLELINMDEAVDLTNVNVKFLTSTEPGTTNWFLTCTSTAVNGLNGIEYAPGLTGVVMYEADRVGAVVVPEPAVFMLGALAVLAAIKRQRRDWTKPGATRWS